MAYTQLSPRAGRSIASIVIPLLIAALIVALVVVIAMLPPDTRSDLRYVAQDALPIVMFLTLAVLLFSGYPVAFVLGGVALTFGLLGFFLGSFKLRERQQARCEDSGR
jgi:TRAP-type mannitol/chloroaromatic compound transport system permease large subunit